MRITKKELERRCTEAYDTGVKVGIKQEHDRQCFVAGADSVRDTLRPQKVEAICKLITAAGQAFNAISGAISVVSEEQKHL